MLFKIIKHNVYIIAVFKHSLKKNNIKTNRNYMRKNYRFFLKLFNFNNQSFVLTFLATQASFFFN